MPVDPTHDLITLRSYLDSSKPGELLIHLFQIPILFMVSVGPLGSPGGRLGSPDGGPGAKGNHEDGAHQGGQGHGRQSGSCMKGQI